MKHWTKVVRPFLEMPVSGALENFRGYSNGKLG